MNSQVKWKVVSVSAYFVNITSSFNLTDSKLCKVIEAWIALLAVSYQDLIAINSIM